MLKMGIPSLLKTQSNKRFNFKPRYYDEVKERVEYRKKQILAEEKYQKRLENDHELALRERMQAKWERNTRANANKKANRRILVIIAILSLIAYYFLYR